MTLIYTNNFSKLEIYENIKHISEIDNRLIFPTDYNRRHFLLSELGTLRNISDLVELDILKSHLFL